MRILLPLRECERFRQPGVMTVDVSVVICTRNRAASLRSTLDALAGVALPDGWSIELVVGDNGSTDGTCEVVKNASLRGMEGRYVREEMPGKSRAYNRGISEARGRVMLFTDD